MKNPHLTLSSAKGLAAFAGVLCLLSPTVHAQSRHALSTHVPPMVAAGLKATGDLPDTNVLHLSIGLPLRNQAGLDTLLSQLYDPKSPNYHQFLSVADFTGRFGPSQADYDALRAFASDNGLVERHTFANRMVLSVDASVAAIRKAFHVNIHTYENTAEHRTFFAPDAEPSLDLSVPVLHIAGLDNSVLPRPADLKRSPAGGSSPASQNGTGPGGNYFGYDFRHAYAPGVSLDGSGQNVALFEYDGYYDVDITTYEQLAGLPNVNLVNVPIDGGVAVPGGGLGEVSLDIEMVMDMAPGISTIFVYESPGGPADDILSRIATDNTCRQISASWFYGTDPESDSLYQEFATQGQSFFNAAGDGDAFAPGSDESPVEKPYLTVVGGTELSMIGQGVSYASEQVWNEGFEPPGGNPQRNGYVGTGGGYSSTYSIPPYQAQVSMANNHGSPQFRNFPDVAMTSQSIWVIAGQNTQTGSYGGTSCATPLWAGFTALANEQAKLYSMPALGFINPAVYAIGQSANYTACFHDITTGSNTSAASPTNFYAVPGYDLCSGWGTPTGSNLINALAPPLHIPVLLVVTDSVSGGNGNGIIDNDECNDLTFLITNVGSATATGIQGFLYSTTLGAIVAQSSVTFPNLPPGTAASSSASFTLSTEPNFVCGTPIDLVLILKSDQASQTNNVQLPTGVVGPPISFLYPVPSNNVPQGDLNGINMPLTVGNLQAAAKITVSVFAQVEFDEGLSLTLISPNGTQIPLTGFPDGGLGSDYGTGCNQPNETTFDDNALASISAGSAPFVGTFQPLTPLSTLLPCSGTNLNGTWTLNAVEEFQGDPTVIQCWSLNIEPYVCEDGGGQCPGSDLSITMSEAPSPSPVFSNVVYNLTVSNAGPSSANAVVISQTLPPGFTFVTTSNYPAQVTPGTTLQISMGALPVYGAASIDVIASPTLPGLGTSVATVESTGTDPNPNNNTASASTLITLPSADLAVSMTAFPPAILQGGLETFTIIVTNNGPFAATAVTVTNVLPVNGNLVASSVSQGSVVLPGSLFDLGTLDPGSNAVVTVTISPTGAGNLTDTATVGLGIFQTDPNLLNNTASFTVTVGPSADLGVSAIVRPGTVVSGANYSYVGTVVNNGPSAASSVVFTQTIPGGTGLSSSTFVSSSVPGVIVTNGVITWNVGNMASGATLLISNVLKAPTIQPGGRPILLSSTLSVFGEPGDANTNNNVAVVTNLAEVPTVTIVPVSAVLTSQTGSETNGAINPNQTVGVQLFLQNAGNLGTTNLTASLQSSGGVSLPSSGQNYGALAPGGAPVGEAFSFLASGANGGTVVATLALQDGSTSLGTVAFVFYLPQVQTFWNTNIVFIPATNLIPPAAGIAEPYPSTLQVSNVTGFVSKVTVTVSNLNHTFPNDIGLLLVSPSSSVALMDATASLATMPASNVDLLLDSTASITLPSEGNLTSGTFRPADYNPGDVFTNAVFPAGGTNALVAPYSTNLASFNGLPANGLWALYAHDDSDGDFGAISNGWAVTITTVVPVNPTNGLEATMAASTNKIVEGDTVTYVFSVTNNGPTAVNAYLTNFLPAGLSFVSATSNYTQPGPANVYLYNLGTLNPGAGVTITNVDMGGGSGMQTNFIAAGLPVSTFTIGANSASSALDVTVPVADLAAGISVNNNPGVVGHNVIYTLSVTNLGPSNSLATSGSFPLTGLSLSSVSTTQGSYAVNNGVLVCSFSGTLPFGEVAVATVTAAPLSAGTLTNVWTVSNLSDTNSAATVLTVNIPAPVMVPVSATLLTPSANGAISANVPVTVAFTLANQGFASTSDLTATLLAANNVVPTGSPAQTYGAIAAGTTGTESFNLTVTGSPGNPATATLALMDGTNSLGNVSFAPFLIPSTTSFASSAGITIPQFGTANLYPSQIFVSGLTNSQGSNLLVSKVTVTLNDFAHTFPHDVNVLLDSPSGQELIVMGHAGGGYGATNVTLTFDDAATQILPTNQLTSGTYLPTDYAPVDTFPDLAPASTSSNLAIFDGSNPNGPWSLYVYDDTPGNAGAIAGGWSLGLTVVNPVNPAALLAVGMISSPNPVLGGNYLSYQITVTNLGPDTAGSVVLTDTLPPGVIYSDSSTTQGAVSVSGNIVTCNLGALSANATAVVTIRVITAAAGTLVNTATATASNTTDLYLPADTAINSTAVLNPGIFLEATNSSSGLQLTVLGQPSQSYVIQVSSDLLTWTPVFTNTTPLGNPSFTYTDPQTNVLRFFRVVHGPQ